MPFWIKIYMNFVGLEPWDEPIVLSIKLATEKFLASYNFKTYYVTSVKLCYYWSCNLSKYDWWNSMFWKCQFSLTGYNVKITDNLQFQNRTTFPKLLFIYLDCIPELLGNELFSPGPRSIAVAIASICNWVGNFVASIVYPLIRVCQEC